MPITLSMSTFLIIRKIGLPGNLFIALAMCCCGCTPLTEYVQNGFKVGPNYRKPDAAVAGNWIDASDKRVRTDSDDLSKWWTVFKDPVLNNLVCNAYHQNLTCGKPATGSCKHVLSLASPSARSSRSRRR